MVTSVTRTRFTYIVSLVVLCNCHRIHTKILPALCSYSLGIFISVWSNTYCRLLA